MRDYRQKKEKVGDFTQIEEYEHYHQYFGKMIRSVYLSKLGEKVELFVWMFVTILTPLLISFILFYFSKDWMSGNVTFEDKGALMGVVYTPMFIGSIVLLWVSIVGIISNTYLIEGMLLPYYFLTKTARYISDITKHKKNKITNKHRLVVTFMGDNFRGIVHTNNLNIEYSNVIQILNKKVGLKNGYKTRLYNILESREKGVYPTIRHFEVNDSEFVLEPALDDKSVIDYFGQLYIDYQLELEYQSNLKYYHDLKESEDNRMDNLQQARENVRELLNKKEEVKEKLFNNNRVNKIEKYLEESKKSIKEVEQEYNQLRNRG